MKVITTGLLNRFWTKGIKPWLDKRIKSYADLMVTTASGYTPDALAVKEGFTELNGKLLNITKVKVSFTKSSDGATVLIDGIKKGACIIAMRNVISNGTVATYITSALCDTDGVVKLYLNTNVSSVTTDVTIIWAN